MNELFLNRIFDRRDLIFWTWRVSLFLKIFDRRDLKFWTEGTKTIFDRRPKILDLDGTKTIFDRRDLNSWTWMVRICFHGTDNGCRGVEVAARRESGRKPAARRCRWHAVLASHTS